MSNVPKLKVQIRGGFSDRNNIDPINKTLQYKDFDERTRTAFINTINILYSLVFENVYDYDSRTAFWDFVLSDVYSQRVHYNRSNRTYNEEKMLEIINETITSDSYDAVLSLIEFICRAFETFQSYRDPKSLTVFQVFNKVFEKEYVGYRFINKIITPITDPCEISEIEEAGLIKKNKVAQHLDKSLELLSNREHPDYENSIKESISAVEAMCNAIVGKETTLGEALQKINDSGITIHPALKDAFKKLYGYTSDASGIRHSGKFDAPNSTFEEAKFMVVSCSAFINYLRGVESKLH